MQSAWKKGAGKVYWGATGSLLPVSSELTLADEPPVPPRRKDSLPLYPRIGRSGWRSQSWAKLVLEVQDGLSTVLADRWGYV